MYSVGFDLSGVGFGFLNSAGQAGTGIETLYETLRMILCVELDLQYWIL